MKPTKPLLIGLLVGYLITSGANIPFPPDSFWHFFFGLVIVGIIIGRAYFKINDDMHPGEF